MTASESSRPGGGVVALAALILVTGWFVGLHLLRGDGTDASEYLPACRTQTVKAGEQLKSSLVTVDVYNGSDRSGLASTVSMALHDRGFRPGVIANSPSQITPAAVTILTENKDDPRVRLVAQQFDQVDVRRPDFSTGSGVTVVVGNDFTTLKTDAATTIKAASEVSVCY